MASMRRIFPLNDWATAHEALYTDSDVDSSLDPSPFSVTKGNEPSSSASSSAPIPATATATAPDVGTATLARAQREFPPPRRRNMSLPWRRQSSVLRFDDLESRFRDFTLERSQTISNNTVGAAMGSSAAGCREDATSDLFAARNGNTSSNGKEKGKGKAFGRMFRRASVSIKGFVHRQTPAATGTTQDQDHTRDAVPRPWFFRTSHVPRASLTHHPISQPLSGPTEFGGYKDTRQPQSRPATSHGTNATWHRLRQAASFRHSRVLYGDWAVPTGSSSSNREVELGVPQQQQHIWAPPVARPGMGNEPPVIPRNTGSGARAAVAAWQSEMFPTIHPHDEHTGLGLVPRNRRLALDEGSHSSDQESGIGIALTRADDENDEPDLDLVTANGEQILLNMHIGSSSPGPEISRLDFITQLPAELGIQILSFLDAANLASASRVSRHWHHVCTTGHIWRESFLREMTGTYACSGRIEPGSGQGVPRVTPDVDWRQAYKAREELERRWREGRASSVYLSGHGDSIYCLQFDEDKIITGSRDKTIRIWDMHTMACRLVIGPPDVVKSASLLHDDNGNPTHTAVWENPNPNSSPLTSPISPTASPFSPSPSDPPANTHTAPATTTTSVPTTVSFATHHNASILSLQYDDKILVTGSSDSTAIIHDLRSGYRPIRRLRGHAAAVLDLCFDGRHIVTCSKDITICVWDRATGTLLRQLRGHSGPVNAVQMRGHVVVSCSGDFRVKLWDVDTGRGIREFTGHTKGLACSQFSADGRYVASAGNDRTIKIWDANTGEELHSIKAHDSLVRSLHIDSVSGRLVSGSYDTDIKVFDMATGRQLLDFPRWHASWVLSAKSDYRRIVSTGQEGKVLVMDFGKGVPGVECLESCRRPEQPATSNEEESPGTAEVEVDADVDGGYI